MSGASALIPAAARTTPVGPPLQRSGASAAAAAGTPPAAAAAPERSAAAQACTSGPVEKSLGVVPPKQALHEISRSATCMEDLT